MAALSLPHGEDGTSTRRHPAVEGGFDGAPIRHVFREDGLKARAVRRLDQVSELVQYQVFDGARRFRGEAAVKHDVARARAACPPLAFHGADADAGGADAEPLFPLRDECVKAALEFAALEAFEVPLDFGGIVRVAGVDDQAGWRSGGFDDLGSDPAGGAPHFQHMRRTEEPVLLPRHVPQLRPGRLGGDAGLMVADPIGFGGHERRDACFRHSRRRRHRHAAVGRVNAQVDVLDAFARELEFDAGGGHGAIMGKSLGTNLIASWVGIPP